MPYQINKSRRSLAIITGVACVGALAGCSTGLLMEEVKGPKVVKQGEIVLTDTIYALGRPDTNLAQQIKNDKAVAFIGKTNMYLLVKGGELLLRMSQELNPTKIKLVTDSGSSIIKDKTVWGFIRLNYSEGKMTEVSQAEKLKLAALGFSERSDKKAYEAVVYIEGAVYPTINLAATNFARLATSPQLSWRAPQTTERKPDLSKAALLPVTLLVDVVTAPFQLLGFAVLPIMLKDAFKMAP